MLTGGKDRRRARRCRPRLEPWCNGNTAGFGPAVPGSNPGGSTSWIVKQTDVDMDRSYDIQDRLDEAERNLEEYRKKYKRSIDDNLRLIERIHQLEEQLQVAGYNGSKGCER